MWVTGNNRGRVLEAIEGVETARGGLLEAIEGVETARGRVVGNKKVWVTELRGKIRVAFLSEFEFCKFH